MTAGLPKTFWCPLVDLEDVGVISPIASQPELRDCGLLTGILLLTDWRALPAIRKWRATSYFFGFILQI